MCPRSPQAKILSVFEDILGVEELKHNYITNSGDRGMANY